MLEDFLDNAVPERNRNIVVAYLLLRVTIGVNILIHGVSRLLTSPATFAHALVPMFQKTPLPVWSVYGFGLVLPWVEAVLGFAILIGFRTRIALIAGSLLILVLTFGSTLRQDWESAGLQLIYAGMYAALLAFQDRDVYSLDALLQERG